MHIVCTACGVVNDIKCNLIKEHLICEHCKVTLLDVQAVEVDQPLFEKVMEYSDLPVLVYFWGPRCAPCKMMSMWYAEAAKILQGEFVLLKVNTEVELLVSKYYRIRSTPMMMLFENGQEIARQAGAMQSAAIVNWVKEQ